MQDKPLPTVLDKLYENQLALAAAVEELALWIEVRGEDEDTAMNVRSALDTLERNAEVINRSIAGLKVDAAAQ